MPLPAPHPRHGCGQLSEALWRNAERAIRHAEVIALVGFSFTPTDLHVDSLFRIAQAGGNNRLRSLVIANPSKSDRRRIRSVFSRSLEQGCLVRQYSTLGDFARATPRIMTNPDADQEPQ